MTAVWVAVLVAALAAAYAAMWLGWRNRAARQAELPEPQWLEGMVVSAGGISGTYVSTTVGGHWMDRVAAHTLGTISPATLVGGRDSVQVIRDGGRAFEIPTADLVGVRRERGIAGKVRDRDGIVVITWQLGDHEVDTGFRPDIAREAGDVENMVHALMDRASHA